MRVIGTAGHVDHGKSALVAALTGTHPDRLKEEQVREMTIDLGFAWMTLGNGEPVGIVDVPGHRDFIENMLAGVGGIDAALFVIAADEGVMPQTREHLAILDLLKINGGVVAINKVDLVDDPEWLDLVEGEIRKTMAGTVLEDAPLVRVSARTGSGIEDLKNALETCLAERAPKPDFKKPRLNIDRVFTIAGFGSVVTGTLLDGSLKVGDEIEILPSGLHGRVRGLQSHKKKEDTAVPGSRTAVNVTGVELQDLKRGDVLSHPGNYRTTQRVDVAFELLADASRPLLHNDEVKFFIGAAEVLARVRLLAVDQLMPGQTGWLQMELKDPVVAQKNDRYILRRPSPGETLGGGEIIEPHPGKRHKRFAPDVVQRLQTLKEGSPAEVFLRTLDQIGAGRMSEAASASHLAEDKVMEVIKELIFTGQVVLLGETVENLEISAESILIRRTRWETESKKASELIERFHSTFPLRKGMPREEFKSRLKMNPKVYARAYDQWMAEGFLIEDGNQLRRPDFKVKFNQEQETKTRNLLKMFESAPYNTPSVKDCQAALGVDLYQAVLEQGILTQVSPEVVFRPKEMEAMQNFLKEYLTSHGTITAAEFRDHYQTSRKYALAALEHLDSIGLTVREGDNRRLKNPSANPQTNR